MTKAQCPDCGAIINHFEKIGDSVVWVCPECKGEIDIESVEKIEDTGEIPSKE